MRNKLLRLSAFLIINKKDFSDIKDVCSLLEFWDYGCFNTRFKYECLDTISIIMIKYSIDDNNLEPYKNYSVNTTFYEAKKLED